MYERNSCKGVRSLLKRKEFIARLAEKGYTQRDAGAITDDVFATILEILAEGKSVSFHGFGVFGSKFCKAKEVASIHGGRTTVPAHLAPKFTPGKLLKRLINEKRVSQEDGRWI